MIKRLHGLFLPPPLARVLAALLLTLMPGLASAQELTMGLRSEFVIDPHFLFLGPNMAAARHLYDSFVDRDADAHQVPGLAQSWRLLDPTTWEFKLRPGVVFHDGTPFTSADVLFSIKRIPSIPNNPGSYASNLRSIVEVTAPDPMTVRIKTAWPNPALPGQMTNIFIVSEKAAAGASSADFASGKAAIGTGPFKLVSYSRGEQMVLERSQTYWGEKPPWQRVTSRVITNESARVAALLAGDVDLIEEVPTGDVATLEKSGKANVYRRVSDRIMYVLPNYGAARLAQVTDAAGAPLASNPFRDIRVRQAISKAINRQALVERALDGAAVPASQVVPEGFGGFDPALPVERYDPEGAKKLLAEAGFPKGFGLTIACTNDRYVNDARICQSLGQMLSRVGLATKVETYPGSVYFPKIKVPGSEVPLMFFGTSSSSTRDATHVLSLALHGFDPEREFGASNRGAFRDPNLDKLIEAAIVEVDPAAHEAKLRQAMDLGTELLGAIPLYNQMTIAASRKGITYTPRMDEQVLAQGARPAP
jgi:peptide/nickel transport system substrate-binding protein